MLHIFSCYYYFKSAAVSHDSGILSAYDKLADNGLFNINTYYDYCNLDSSNSMLKNYESCHNSSEKKQFLIKAFSNCPYNIKIYEYALREHLLDIESLETPLFLKLADPIRDLIHSQIDIDFKNRSLEYLKDDILLIAYVNNVSEELALDTELTFYTTQIYDNYQKLKESLFDNNKLIDWIKCNLTDDLQDFINISNNTFESSILKVIDFIIPESFLDYFQTNNVIDLQRISIDNEKHDSISYINQDYAARISDKVIALKNDYENKLAVLKAASTDRDNEKNRLENIINQKMQQQTALGFFKIKQKRAIAEEITILQQELLQVDTKFNISKLEKDFSW